MRFHLRSDHLSALLRQSWSECTLKLERAAPRRAAVPVPDGWYLLASRVLPITYYTICTYLPTYIHISCTLQLSFSCLPTVISYLTYTPTPTPTSTSTSSCLAPSSEISSIPNITTVVYYCCSVLNVQCSLRCTSTCIWRECSSSIFLRTLYLYPIPYT